MRTFAPKAINLVAASICTLSISGCFETISPVPAPLTTQTHTPNSSQSSPQKLPFTISNEENRVLSIDTKPHGCAEIKHAMSVVDKYFSRAKNLGRPFTREEEFSNTNVGSKGLILIAYAFGIDCFPGANYDTISDGYSSVLLVAGGNKPNAWANARHQMSGGSARTPIEHTGQKSQRPNCSQGSSMSNDAVRAASNLSCSAAQTRFENRSNHGAACTAYGALIVHYACESSLLKRMSAAQYRNLACQYQETGVSVSGIEFPYGRGCK